MFTVLAYCTVKEKTLYVHGSCILYSKRKDVICSRFLHTVLYSKRKETHMFTVLTYCTVPYIKMLKQEDLNGFKPFNVLYQAVFDLRTRSVPTMRRKPIFDASRILYLTDDKLFSILYIPCSSNVFNSISDVIGLPKVLEGQVLLLFSCP